MTEKKLNKKETQVLVKKGKKPSTNSRLTGLKSEEKKYVDNSAFPEGEETTKREVAQPSKTRR